MWMNSFRISTIRKMSLIPVTVLYSLPAICLLLVISNTVKPGNLTFPLFILVYLDRNIFARVCGLYPFDFYNLVSSAGIDCFKCVSVNGTNPMCEDPFHNNYTSDILERPCMGGRKGRNGLFPGSSCLKVVGTYCKY